MKLILSLFTSLFFGAAALSAADAKPAGVPDNYPLKTCPVSGEKIGEMGKPVKASHNGTDVYLCCKSCLKDFNKDPEKYTKVVKDAEKR